MVIRKFFQEEPMMNRVRGIEIRAKNLRPPSLQGRGLR